MKRDPEGPSTDITWQVPWERGQLVLLLLLWRVSDESVRRSVSGVKTLVSAFLKRRSHAPEPKESSPQINTAESPEGLAGASPDRWPATWRSGCGHRTHPACGRGRQASLKQVMPDSLDFCLFFGNRDDTCWCSLGIGFSTSARNLKYRLFFSGFGFLLPWGEAGPQALGTNSLLHRNIFFGLSIGAWEAPRVFGKSLFTFFWQSASRPAWSRAPQAV